MRIGQRVVRSLVAASREISWTMLEHLKSLMLTSGEARRKRPRTRHLQAREWIASERSAGSARNPQESLSYLIPMREGRLADLSTQTAPGNASIPQAFQRTHRQCEITILRGIDAIRRAQVRIRVVDRAALRQLATVVEVSGYQLELKIENGLKQAHLHAATASGDAASDHAGEDSLHEMSPGKHIDDRQS